MSESLILQMDQVSATGMSAHVAGLSGVSIRLAAGEMLVLEPERHAEAAFLYDVASGLVAPQDGVVAFCGREWGRMGLFGQSAARGRIGRIFESEGWVSNLNMFENISLQQRHHTRRSDRDLRAAVLALGERVGLRDIMEDRPHQLSRAESRLGQWVRAFLGQPDLLLLDAPLLDVQVGGETPLLELVGEARSRGCAVVWCSPDAGRRTGDTFGGARQGRLRDGQILIAEETAVAGESGQ